MGFFSSVRTVVPCHSSSLYNGKVLEPLPAVNEEQLKRFECGVWSDVMPDQLRPIIQRPETFRDAIGLINTVSQTHVRFKSYWKFLLMAIALTSLIVFACIAIPLLFSVPIWVLIQDPQMMFLISFCVILDIFIHFYMLVNREHWRIMIQLNKVIGQANILLFKEKVLIGYMSNSKLLLVHVLLDGCRRELTGLSVNSELFEKYIQDYSCAYTYFLAKRFFPWKPISNPGHLEGGLCFCQYVILGLSRQRCCFCCREQYSHSASMPIGIANPSYV